MIPERQPVAGQRRFVISLTFQRERLIQVVEALGTEGFRLL
jgi:hypothetical protein